MFRVRHNLDKKFKFVDPDPGMSHTQLMKSKCLLCSKEAPEKNEITNEITNDQQGDWMKSTKILPKQFSYINIQSHAKNSGKKKNPTEKPLHKGYKFFYENYVFDVFGKSCLSSQETQVKCKCYRSQKKRAPSCCIGYSFLQW